MPKDGVRVYINGLRKDPGRRCRKLYLSLSSWGRDRYGRYLRRIIKACALRMYIKSPSPTSPVRNRRLPCHALAAQERMAPITGVTNGGGAPPHAPKARRIRTSTNRGAAPCHTRAPNVRLCIHAAFQDNVACHFVRDQTHKPVVRRAWEKGVSTRSSPEQQHNRPPILLRCVGKWSNTRVTLLELRPSWLPGYFWRGARNSGPPCAAV